MNTTLTSQDTEDDNSTAVWRTPWHTAGLVGGIVLLASLFGILTRPIGFLAALWPTNAVLLATFVRKPSWATPLSWGAATVAYLLADLMTGSSLLLTLWLTAANLSGVFTATVLFQRIRPEDRKLQRPLSVLFLFAICSAAAIVAAVVGGAAAPVFFNRDLVHGLWFWFTTELANFIVIVPVILVIPPRGEFTWRDRPRRQSRLATLDMYGPILGLVASVILGILVGGPGAIVFPAPALLWCALAYSLVVTTGLTALVCCWMMIAITANILSIPFSSDYMESTISLRLGITLLALGPLTVASINAVRNDLLKKLDRAANHDALTDTLSRRAFVTRAQAMLSKLNMSYSPLTVLMLDLDNFKLINDHYGHAAGDTVLITFADVVRSVLRDDDLFGRMGGEEFAVVLPHLSYHDTVMVAERIRKAVEATHIPINSGTHTQDTFAQNTLSHAPCAQDTRAQDTLQISVSIGVAHLPRTADSTQDERVRQTIEPLLLMADNALYEAKHTGRNRVVIASSPTDSANSPQSAQATFISLT